MAAAWRGVNAVAWRGVKAVAGRGVKAVAAAVGPLMVVTQTDGRRDLGTFTGTVFL